MIKPAFAKKSGAKEVLLQTIGHSMIGAIPKRQNDYF